MSIRSTFVLSLVFAAGCSFLVATAHAAPPKLNYLFPAGAARGQVASVTAAGEFSNWPVQAWTDHAGVTVEAEKDKGKLKVTVAPDATPGIAWLRLFDGEGATSLRPFVIGTLREADEVEPNDSPDKPQALDGSAVVNGRLGKAGDVDGFSLTLRAGQTLVAAMQANTGLGSPMDGVLQVCELVPERVAAGANRTPRVDAFVVEHNDDAIGLDPLIAFTAPRDGTYLVRTFAFPVETNSIIGYAGGDNFIYRLTITTGGLVDHALPLAIPRGATSDVRLFGWNIPEAANKLTLSDAASIAFQSEFAGALTLPVVDHASVIALESSDQAQPQPVTLPVTVSGRIESPRDVDALSFAAKKGQKLRLRIESRALGFPLDPLLIVTDASGKQLAEVDDTNNQRDAQLDFSPPTDGDYRVLVRDVHHHGGFRYVYRLTIAEVKPDFALTLAADSFVLTAGKPLEIPITIERRDAFSGDIDVAPLDLPPGVSATPVVSKREGDSAKSVKLVLAAEAGAAIANRPIRIVGTNAGDTPQTRAVATWLTIKL